MRTLPLRLHPGDVLLYQPTGVFGWLIRFHTGGPCAHVEVYLGGGKSIASRDRLGVGIYPLRTSELGWVLRPNLPFDTDNAWDWYERTGKGQRYGWLDLAQFFGYNVNGPGIVCSPCAVCVLRAAGVPVFGMVPAEHIAPNDFLLSELLSDVTAELFARGSADGGARGHVPAVLDPA